MKLLLSKNFGATEEERRKLEALGLEITDLSDEHVPAADADQYDAVITTSLFYYTDIKAFTRLKFVHALSVGLDRFPQDYCREKGIELHNVGGAFCRPMAEWTLMSLLELQKRAPQMWEKQKSGIWKRDHGWQEMDGKTALIVGFGDYGREVAKRLKAFEVRTVVANRSEKTSPFIDEYIPLSELDSHIPEADFVILCVSQTPETHHLMSARRLALMKPSAVLINGARGSLVDEAALTGCLQRKTIAGAALDVFEKEPLPADSPLWQLDNVLITPHASFLGERNHERIFDILYRNLKTFLNRS